MEKWNLIFAILIILQIIIIPWCVWVTAKIFRLNSDNSLTKQKVEFLETNLVKDIQHIKDSVEQTSKAATEANTKLSASLQDLDKKLDLFTSNELHILKKALLKHDEHNRKD